MERFESSIERKDRKVTAELGGKAILFTYLNTKLYEHQEQYSQFDHVYRVNDDLAGGAMLMRSDAPELYQVLVDNDFPRLVMPYPSEQDESAIMAHYDKELHNGLNELLEGSDE